MDLARPIREPQEAQEQSDSTVQQGARQSVWSGLVGRLVRLTRTSGAQPATTEAVDHGTYAAVAGEELGDLEVGRTQAAASAAQLAADSSGNMSEQLVPDSPLASEPARADDKPSGPLTTLSSLLRKSGSIGRITGTDSSTAPVCLICLDPLTQEDFEQGEAIQLECKCRGDLAMRHKTCAAKWAGVKGDNICDICKEPIHNLPEPIMPEGVSDDELDAHQAELNSTLIPLGAHSLEPPTFVDSVFDCIRVMWVAMIVCILFFEMDLSRALWTGVTTGLGYTVLMRIMYRSHIAFAQSYQHFNGSLQQAQGADGQGARPHGALTIL